MSSDMSIYRRLFQQARPYWPHMAGIFLLSLLEGPLGLIAPLPLKIAVDSAIGPNPLPDFLRRIVPASVENTPNAILFLAAAMMVGIVEFAGGILFAAGIGSRLVSLVLFVNMTVAYLAAPDDRVNFSHIFSKPEDFYGAGPYTYWFAALLIMILGPGLFALDTLLRRWVDERPTA